MGRAFRISNADNIAPERCPEAYAPHPDTWDRCILAIGHDGDHRTGYTWPQANVVEEASDV